jgi:hypothetical protein
MNNGSILISHRGNINGRKPELENSPSYIEEAISQDFNVEIDVWYQNGFWLGHDAPSYFIEESFLENFSLWCHAKNSQALIRMSKNPFIHCFWHENDRFTLTSRGYIWAYPSKEVVKNSIIVLPKIHNNDTKGCLGICSNYISSYK